MASIADNEVKLEVDMNVVRALESVDEWSGITPSMIFNLHIPGLKKSSFTFVIRIKKTAVSSVRTNSFSHLRLVGWDEKINFNVGVYPCSFSLSCQMVSGPFWLKIFPLLFKSSWSPLGPGNMAQWGQQAQQGDRRGWGGRDRGDRDQWTGGRSGGGGGGYGAHNPYEVQLPKFLTTVVTTDDKDWSSIMMVDKRDDRLVSPFQAWLVSEIMANSASSINVLTERDQVMPPNSGFHLSLFANYTLDGIKAVLAVSIDSTTGSICGGWDPPTARALAHPAFQPFSWPMLRETSASYTDLKIYNGNEILFHWVFRGYRADTDLTVQQQFVDEILVRDVHRGKPRLSAVVAIFVGWRVTVMSFECGGRTYAVGPKGSVVAGDHARSRWELRVCSRASDEAVGSVPGPQFLARGSRSPTYRDLR